MGGYGSGPHGVTKYRNGCRCAICRAASASAKRERRAARPDKPRASHQAKPKTGNVVALPGSAQPTTSLTPREMGPVERETRREVELAPRSDVRPSIAAQAIALARSIDDPSMAAVVATNSRQLQALLKELQTGKKKSSGRLQVVSQMAGRKRAQ